MSNLCNQLGLDAKAVRAWAKENGYSVGEKGRMSSEVVRAYLNAVIDAQLAEDLA